MPSENEEAVDADNWSYSFSFSFDFYFDKNNSYKKSAEIGILGTKGKHRVLLHNIPNPILVELKGLTFEYNITCQVIYLRPFYNSSIGTFKSNSFYRSNHILCSHNISNRDYLCGGQSSDYAFCWTVASPPFIDFCEPVLTVPQPIRERGWIIEF